MLSSIISRTAVAVVALASVASAGLQGTDCVARKYTGSVCKDYVNYFTAASSLAEEKSDATVQGQIDNAISGLNKVKSSPDCFDRLLAIACGIEFPKCDAKSEGAAGKTQILCKTNCQDALSVCTPVIKNLIGDAGVLLLQSNLHNCSFLTSSNPEPWGADGQCLAAKKSGAATAAACPFPFLPKTPNTVNKNCQDVAPGVTCCIPCPVQDYVYPKGQFNIAVMLTQIGSATSALLVGYVVLSWAVLPGRRQHPGDIVLHFAIACMIWQSCALFLIGNPRRIQCADEVTTSTASNNTLCGIQAAFTMCSVHATVFWAGYMIFNLHATIVWRSNFFERFKPLGVTLCWGLPGIFTFLPFLISSVDAVTGVTCLIAAADANKLFFSVHAVIVLPAFLLNVATMIHIMIVARRSTSSNLSNGYSSNGYSGNGYSGEAKPISARRQMLQLLKLNWRALFLGLVFVVTYVTYVIFYQVVVTPLATTDSSTQWVKDWSLCMATTGGDQSLCHDKFKDNIPSFSLIIVSAILVSSVGIWLFIIFGFNLQILYDWVNWGHDLFSGGRKREEPQYEEPEWR
ncbi:hypothetical protein HDU97_006063 [Phlyctochytrium planicorne]|nr:hypothetical protein HDU97_006063 [Phlyctochytrium planicorne]